MGSKCRIVVYAPSESSAAEACGAAFERIGRLNDVLSDYSPVSEASRVMADQPGVWHPVSDDLADAIGKSLAVSKATGGAFDATVAPLTSLWRSAKRTLEMPPPETIESARARSGYRLLELDDNRVRFPHAGMGLDFGGIGKGIAADEALAVLAEAGLTRALIDFGGDLRIGDPPPGEQPGGWLVSVRDGLSESRTVRLVNAAVATSGDTERSLTISGVTYSHVLDPRSGFGVERRVGATVIADEGWLADALASAACVVGPEGVADLRDRYPGTEIMVSVGGMERSP